MSTTAQLISEWLVGNGPARVDQIRAGLPGVNPKTVSDVLSRLSKRGEVTRGADGIWSAVAPEVELELPARRPATEPAASVLPWPDLLGAAVPGARCDSSCDLGCSGPLWRYTGDHTAIVCPECGPDCWDISPAAARRAKAHQGTLRARSARTGTASVALPQAELDRQAIALNRRKRAALEQLRAELNRPEVRGDVLHDLTWLLEQYTDARTDERCDELDEWFDEVPLPRRPIGQVIRGWFGQAADDDDEVVDAELVDDEDQGDEAAALEPARPPAPRRAARAAVMPVDPFALHRQVVADTTAGARRIAELSRACEQAGRLPTTEEIYRAAGLEWGRA